MNPNKRFGYSGRVMTKKKVPVVKGIFKKIFQYTESVNLTLLLRMVQNVADTDFPNVMRTSFPKIKTGKSLNAVNNVNLEYTFRFWEYTFNSAGKPPVNEF